MLPKSLIGRTLAILWLVCGLGLLVFAYVQQSVHDMPVVFVWLLIFLTFPVGLVVTPITGAAWSSLASSIGLAYHPFWHSLPLWAAAIFFGYLQWFILVPKLFRRLSRASTGA